MCLGKTEIADKLTWMEIERRKKKRENLREEKEISLFNDRKHKIKAKL